MFWTTQWHTLVPNSNVTYGQQNKMIIYHIVLQENRVNAYKTAWVWAWNRYQAPDRSDFELQAFDLSDLKRNWKFHFKSDQSYMLETQIWPIRCLRTVGIPESENNIVLKWLIWSDLFFKNIIGKIWSGAPYFFIHPTNYMFEAQFWTINCLRTISCSYLRSFVSTDPGLITVYMNSLPFFYL